MFLAKLEAISNHQAFHYTTRYSVSVHCFFLCCTCVAQVHVAVTEEYIIFIYWKIENVYNHYHKIKRIRAGREESRQKGSQADKYVGKRTYGQTERQKDKQTDRYEDRQEDGQESIQTVLRAEKQEDVR